MSATPVPPPGATPTPPPASAPAHAPAPWAVIAGGGTAGHVLPAIAVGRALVRHGHASDEVLYVGSRRGIETRLVPAAGFRLHALAGRGIERRLTLRNVRSAAELGASVAATIRAFGRARPRVVVSVGGYAAAPCIAAAWLWRVPVIVAESNARAGVANRIAARFAKASAVAFDGTGLPRAVLTGNPVRPEIAELHHGATRAALRLRTRAEHGIEPEQLLVLVFGGSLGARRINDAVIGLAHLWQERSTLVVHHVVGVRDHARVRAVRDDWAAAAKGATGAHLDWRVVEYEDAMPAMLAAADVVVSRAGATTVADATAVGIASVLVPLPSAAEDHQRANARALVAAGGAVLLEDAACTDTGLTAALAPLLADGRSRTAMADAARSLARIDAADRIADLAEQHARTRRAR